MTEQPVIIWFRNDLRRNDHPALHHAFGRPTIPLYVVEEEGEWPLGTGSQKWLHHSLKSLADSLKLEGLSLIIRKGRAQEVLMDLLKETGAKSVFWTRRYEPDAILRDSLVKAALKDLGVDVRSFNGQLLFEPWTIANKQNKPFQVFTPFWKRCLQEQVSSPLQKRGLTPYMKPLKSLEIPFKGSVGENFRPGELGANLRLQAFCKNSLSGYQERRDFPSDSEGISHLSPHLHFGEISPSQIWDAVKDLPQAETFLRQLGWREFAHHLLYHFPHTQKEPLREAFKEFPWASNLEELRRWQTGETGYPIVDAGMRELLQTGFMHNRLRMIVGSFLVKDLRHSWLEGARWFWKLLFDADLANNTLGWQWVGGMGADAAPYFRVFNPTLQGEKFDPEGAYVKKYVPELKHLSAKWIHAPHLAPREVLKDAGIVLGENYPYPMVDHKAAKDLALAAFRALKNG